KYIWSNNSKKIKRFVKVNKYFARLIGLYLAEGGCDDQGKICFSFNSKEKKLINETSYLLRRIFGLKSKIVYRKQSVCCVVACSIILSRFIKKIIPGNVYNKNIPLLFFRT